MASSSSGSAAPRDKHRPSTSMTERLNREYEGEVMAAVRFVDDEEAESKVAAEITLINVTFRHPLSNKELFDVIQQTGGNWAAAKSDCRSKSQSHDGEDAASVASARSVGSSLEQSHNQTPSSTHPAHESPIKQEVQPVIEEMEHIQDYYKVHNQIEHDQDGEDQKPMDLDEGEKKIVILDEGDSKKSARKETNKKTEGDGNIEAREGKKLERNLKHKERLSDTSKVKEELTVLIQDEPNRSRSTRKRKKHWMDDEYVMTSNGRESRERERGRESKQRERSGNVERRRLSRHLETTKDRDDGSISSDVIRHAEDRKKDKGKEKARDKDNRVFVDVAGLKVEEKKEKHGGDQPQPYQNKIRIRRSQAGTPPTIVSPLLDEPLQRSFSTTVVAVEQATDNEKDECMISRSPLDANSDEPTAADLLLSLATSTPSASKSIVVVAPGLKTTPTLPLAHKVAKSPKSVLKASSGDSQSSDTTSTTNMTVNAVGRPSQAATTKQQSLLYANESQTESTGKRKPGRRSKSVGQRASKGAGSGSRTISEPGKFDFDEFQLREAREWLDEWKSSQLAIIDAHPQCYTQEMREIIETDPRCPIKAFSQYEKVLSYVEQLEGGGEPDIASLLQPPWTCVTHSDNSKENTRISSRHNPRGFFHGDYVWACYRAKEFWPAKVVSLAIDTNEKVTVEVNWIEATKYSRGYVLLDQIDPFDYGFAFRFDERKTDKRYIACVGTAISEFVSHTRKSGFFERFMNSKLYAFLAEHFPWTVDAVWPYKLAILNGKVAEAKCPDPSYVLIYRQLDKRSARTVFPEERQLDGVLNGENSSTQSRDSVGEPKTKKKKFTKLNKDNFAMQEKETYRMSVNMCLLGTCIVQADSLIERIEDVLVLPEQDKRIYEMFLRRMNVLACGSMEDGENGASVSSTEEVGPSANPSYLFLSPEKLHVASNPDPLNEPHLVTNGEAVMLCTASSSKNSLNWDDLLELGMHKERRREYEQGNGEDVQSTQSTEKVQHTSAPNGHEISQHQQPSTSAAGQEQTSVYKEALIHNIKIEEDDNTIIAYKEATNVAPRYIMSSLQKPSVHARYDNGNGNSSHSYHHTSLPTSSTNGQACKTLPKKGCTVNGQDNGNGGQVKKRKKD